MTQTHPVHLRRSQISFRDTSHASEFSPHQRKAFKCQDTKHPLLKLFIHRKSARRSLHFYSQGNFFAGPKEQKPDGPENANSPNSIRIREPLPLFIRICSPVIIHRQCILDDFFNSFNAHVSTFTNRRLLSPTQKAA